MTTNETMSTTTSRTTVVWDPAVRFGHWALVAAFTIAYLSAEEESGGPGAWHVWGGYVVGSIVMLRVLWGFVGPWHARFGDFICGPVAALQYLSDFLLGRARRYLGHSPAGGATVIALLVCLAATVATGLMAYGERGQGPLGTTPVSGAYANGKEERVESVIDELHGALANVTLALVVLHILGGGLASIVHRENLVAAMINGRKRVEH